MKPCSRSLPTSPLKATIKKQKMKNYQNFAAVYDSIMDDSLYDKWTDFSLRHFPKNKKKLLELACGTGIQSIRFKQAGFDGSKCRHVGLS